MTGLLVIQSYHRGRQNLPSVRSTEVALLLLHHRRDHVLLPLLRRDYGFHRESDSGVVIAILNGNVQFEYHSVGYQPAETTKGPEYLLSQKTIRRLTADQYALGDAAGYGDQTRSASDLLQLPSRAGNCVVTKKVFAPRPSSVIRRGRQESTGQQHQRYWSSD